jgi:hypothetical protein
LLIPTKGSYTGPLSLEGGLFVRTRVQFIEKVIDEGALGSCNFSQTL